MKETLAVLFTPTSYQALDESTVVTKRRHVYYPTPQMSPHWIFSKKWIRDKNEEKKQMSLVPVIVAIDSDHMVNEYRGRS
jgi:hypothetical protein